MRSKFRRRCSTSKTKRICVSKTRRRELAELSDYLRAARASLASGHAVLGPDTGGDRDDLAFALPANPKAAYRPRKEIAATALLGDAARVWEAA